MPKVDEFPPLSAEGRARLAAAEAQVAGLRALGELAELIAAPSAWTAAAEIARQIRRYESLRLARRPPRSRLEELLGAIAAAELPRTQRRLFALLSDE
ncbi:MAG: hypothetical protein MUC77_04560 [Chromatiaceae bacterium]|jgi:hypothetical protein|nr:hypothetical protein [Chromatiaceae bacterium]